MPLQFHHDTLIVDASCLISLYASNQLTAILQSISKTVAVAAYVADREALFIQSEVDEAGERKKEAIVLQPFINAGLLRIVDLAEEDETETLLHFLRSLWIAGKLSLVQLLCTATGQLLSMIKRRAAYFNNMPADSNLSIL